VVYRFWNPLRQISAYDDDFNNLFYDGRRCDITPENNTGFFRENHNLFIYRHHLVRKHSEHLRTLISDYHGEGVSSFRNKSIQLFPFSRITNGPVYCMYISDSGHYSVAVTT